MKRALLLISGGARGAYEVGVAEHLIIERGLDFDVIAGTSTGCLNAALLAQGQGLEGLQWQVRHLRGIWLGIEVASTSTCRARSLRCCSSSTRPASFPRTRCAA